MKKVTLILLAALVIGCGTISAQGKFRKSGFGNKSKTEVKKTETKAEPQKAEIKKAETKKAEKATKATPAKTAEVKKSAEVKKASTAEKATAAPAKKKATPKVAAAQPAHIDKSSFNGFFTNTYSDGIGGTCTHRLTVNYNAETGTVTGRHVNESGVERDFHGKLVGDKLVCYYDEDNDEFAEMKLYDNNTIKLEGFTGTFKRNDSNCPTVSSSPSGDSGAAAVDRAGYEAIKQYLKEKEDKE
jgi:hypothetical protein